MYYSPEEIALVEFCVEMCPCDEARYPCPLKDACDAQYDEKDSERILCSGILQRMREGSELSEVERKVVEFLTDDGTGMWKDCKIKKRNRWCVNRRICESNEKEGSTNCCGTLLGKLGLLLPDHKILERAVESIICRDQNLIEWEVGEDLVFCERHPTAGNIGQPDILFTGGKTGRLYVIELKVGVATREHVGQLASYVGWYRGRGGFKDVWGILVAEGFHEGARYAMEACQDIYSRLYKLSVEIKRPSPHTLGKA